MPSRLWTRWKRFAHRAAEIQSLFLLALLYWVMVVPFGFLGKLRRRQTAGAAWKTRPETGAIPLDDARRQY